MFFAGSRDRKNIDRILDAILGLEKAKNIRALVSLI
jgi:hypothetical protein